MNKVINSFDIKAPDGFPIAKSSSLLYKNNQERVDGYKVFLSTIRKGLTKNTSHYFYGSDEHVLNKLINNLQEDFPEINIENSYLIGDSDSDIEAGNSMNLSTVKVDNKYTLASWTRSLSNINS